MQQLLAIAGGGALGAVLRFLMASNIHRVFGRDFPYGTLAVNVLGSFAIGIVFVLIAERGLLSAEWRNVIIIGFLGAFTTFSTFSIETLGLLESGELSRAALNILLSVVLCLLATWVGLLIGRQAL
ncbi:MAG: fluoride efflux transporter CrcB [Methylophaga sp.]|nr:MAG: fluoride efflux transporter CrcB [Methylophaga sp.]